MAGWISSKLKVAETFLQQIDQQAAESLKSNEKSRSDISNDEFGKKLESLPLKDQLKKSSNDVYSNLSDLDRRSGKKKLEATVTIPSSNHLPIAAEGDWTELLSSPKPISTGERSNGISALRALKDTKKNSFVISNLTPLDVKKAYKNSSNVSKSSRRLEIENLNGGVSVSSKRSYGSDGSDVPNFVQRKPVTHSHSDKGSAGAGQNGSVGTFSDSKKDKSGDSTVLETAASDNSEVRKESNSEINGKKIGLVDGTFQVQEPGSGLKVVSESVTGSDFAEIMGRVDGDESVNISRREELELPVAGSVLHAVPISSGESKGPTARKLDLTNVSSSESEGSSDSASASDSDEENRKKEERRKRREQIIAEKASAKAAEAIRERENIVARLEGEKQSLEKILEEQQKQQAQEIAQFRGKIGRFGDLTAQTAVGIMNPGFFLNPRFQYQEGFEYNDSIRSGVTKVIERLAPNVTFAIEATREASELQMNMMETMEAVEIEKQKHNSTRMESLARLAALEAKNADLARSLATTQRNLEVQVERIADLRQETELKEQRQEGFFLNPRFQYQEGFEYNDSIRSGVTKVIERLAPNVTFAIEATREIAQFRGKIGRFGDLTAQTAVGIMNPELRRKTSNINKKLSSLSQRDLSKGVEFEQEILEAEYTYVCDKVGQLQDKAKKLEEVVEITRKTLEDPTEVEIELKKRLSQLTDHLIQKQSQVEALSSEKATLLFRIETVSKSLDEPGLPLADSASFSEKEDIEAGIWGPSTSRSGHLQERIRSGGVHIGSILRQLDAVFAAGAMFLRRNRRAQAWSLIYLICLHLWVMYILLSHSKDSYDNMPGAVVSLESINKTLGA